MHRAAAEDFDCVCLWNGNKSCYDAAASSGVSSTLADARGIVRDILHQSVLAGIQSFSVFSRIVRRFALVPKDLLIEETTFHMLSDYVSGVYKFDLCLLKGDINRFETCAVFY